MPIVRGMQAARGTSPTAGLFGALSEGIRKEKARRDKTDAQLIEAMSVLEQIEKRGEETRRTQRAKPLTRQEQAFAVASRGETLPGFSIEETKRLAGAGETRPTKITGTDIKTAAGLGVLERGAPTIGERALGAFQRLIPGAQATEKKIKRFGEAREKFGEVSPELRRGFLGQFGGRATPEISRKIRVRVKATGQTGTIDEQEFDPNIYERI